MTLISDMRLGSDRYGLIHRAVEGSVPNFTGLSTAKTSRLCNHDITRIGFKFITFKTEERGIVRRDATTCDGCEQLL